MGIKGGRINTNDFRVTSSHREELKSMPIYSNLIVEFLDGWFGIIYDLGQKIQAFCGENGIQPPKIQQVKEKFGTLRFYYTWQNDEATEKQKDVVRDWVSKAETATETTCEYCGANGQLLVDDGVWKVVCPDHTRDHEHVYTVEEFTKIKNEEARKRRKCDVCGEGYADSYNDGEKFTNRCEKHKEDFMTSDEYFKSLKTNGDK